MLLIFVFSQFYAKVSIIQLSDYQPVGLSTCPTIKLSDYRAVGLLICTLEKEGACCFAPNGLSLVCPLVCRPPVDCSISFDHLPYLIQWLPIESRCFLLIFRSLGQRSSQTVFVQMFSVQYLLTPLIESCYSWYNSKMPLQKQKNPINFQITWSKVMVRLLVFVQMFSAQFPLTPLLESCQTWYCGLPLERS